MTIVNVKFDHWNGFEKSVDVTSDMCERLGHAKTEEDMILLAIKYIKARWIECMHINSVEIIAC